MSTDPKHLYTPQEYFEFDRTANYKNEYLNGEIIAMGDASPRHVLIATNTASELRSGLRGSGCRVFSVDLRVRVNEDGLYTYPDVVVVCGRPEFADSQEDTLTNPRVIVEVLSASTRNYDRGDKFEQYRSIESLVEYILVSQDRIHVEQYIRQSDGSWRLTETNDPEAEIQLATVNCRLAVREIYADTEDLD